jgi:hypothetical protein
MTRAHYSAEEMYRRARWNGGVSFDGNVLRSIPDSAINQYLYADFSASEWTDSIGSLDLTTISGPTADITAFGGNGGVSGDGGDDYAQGGQFTFIQNNHYSEWAVSFGFSTTDDGGFVAGVNDVNTSYDNLWQIGVGGDAQSGRLGTTRRFNSNNQTIVESSVTVNDGSEYVAILQSTGPTASDIGIYFDPSVDSATVNQSGVDGDGTQSFESSDMTYFARNDQGSTRDHLGITLTDVRWFNSSLSESERSNVFGLYDWYDPSTDAP